MNDTDNRNNGMFLNRPLIILTGPTAAGKTDLSIRLAEAAGGEIISADSMQIYKKMNIGTAKIMPEEMKGIPHYLVDELDPRDEYNVVIFQRKAKQAVKKIYEHGHLPIVVGGTGFYIQALLYGIDFSVHEPEELYRRQLTKLAGEKGKEYLHEMLAEVDPDYAAAVHSNNVKKVIRALEYYHETGERLSAHNEAQRKRTPCYRSAYFVLNHDREILYDRINRRVDQMMRQGLPAEVEGLVREGYTKEMTSMQGLGYKEFFGYFEGRTSLAETVELIKKNTRRFAKRQLTWFRREREAIWMNKQDFQNEEELLCEMLKIIKEKGLLWKREAGF